MRWMTVVVLSLSMILVNCGGSGGDDPTQAPQTMATATAGGSPPAASPPAATATRTATTSAVAPTATTAASPTVVASATVMATATTASASPDASPRATGTTFTGLVRPRTENDPVLAEALIRAGDLPGSWTEDPTFFEDDGDDDSTLCDAPSLEREFEPRARAEIAFAGGALGPFLAQRIAYLTEDDAIEGMEYVRENLTCTTWVETNEDGSQTVWTLREVPFPDIGDDVFIRRAEGEAEGFPVAADFAFVRQGPFLVLVMNFGVGTVDSALTERVVRLTVDRLVDLQPRFDG
jgi:hypothetical protein